jgi:hypothetical protein
MEIKSDIIPQDAVQYLNQLEAEKAAMPTADVEAMKAELHEHVTAFLAKSKSWRKASYEDKWRRYQRNADGIFDPSIAAAKEDWQSKVFVNLTASHRENIHAHLFRTIAGINPPLQMKPRFDLGEIDQSKNIQDIILREMDKANWGLPLDGTMHDADTFGSGFVRLNWKHETAVRKMKRPIKEGFTDNLNPMGLVSYAIRAARGSLRNVAYGEAEEEVTTYRGLDLKDVSIWDVFPDPKALQIKGSTIALRYPVTYGEVVKGAEEGYFLPEAVQKLNGVKDAEVYPEGHKEVQADREVQDSQAPKTDYAQPLDCYELFGMMPQKWAYNILGMPVDNPEKLCSVRIIFHKLCLVGVELNDTYDTEPPLYKLDYFPRKGSFYGIGIPEMLMDPQAVINEVVNQRLDNGAMVLNKSFGIMEKALVNPKQDLVSKPGMMIRLDGNKVPNGDIRNAIMEFSISDTPLRAGFSEVNEAERWAQERTSANRVTLGTAGLVKDANQTLGGQELLRQSAGEKFAYIGLRMEMGFLREFFHGIWKMVYKNITPEDVENSLGPDRAQGFIPVTPEEVERDYVYMPLGVFTMENKALRQSRLLQIRKEFIGAPWVNDEAYYDVIMQNADEDPERFKKKESEILDEQAGMIGQPGMDGGMPPPPDAMPGPGGMPKPLPVNQPQSPGMMEAR